MRRLCAALALALLLLFQGAARAGGTRADDFGTGSLRIPVLPVEFPDEPFEEDALSRLAIALNGTSQESGWHSVKSYYEIASYGALELEFDLLPAYQTEHPSLYYARIYDDERAEYYPEEQILREALGALDAGHDFSIYDANGDGLFDGVLIVYAHPVDYESEDTLWWAWQDQSFLPDSFDGLATDYYLWAGIGMLDEPTGLLENVPCALTYIHEMGHMLGLMDYYDAEWGDDGVSGGLGGADMMDGSVGDHCSFSKMELGWIEPEAVSEAGEYALRPFSASGEALILRKPAGAPSFPRLTGGRRASADEYLLIDLYTPDGLNQPFAESGELFSRPGVRVYHVDASRRRGRDAYWDPYVCTNSSGSHPLICLVEADGDQSIPDTSLYPDGNWAEDSDLFHEGDALEGFCWYDGTPLGFTLRVESLSDSQAILVVE